VPVRALLFDLNGTISHDEELHYELFAELFAREGKPVTREVYFSQLVGHVDPEVVRMWLGPDFPRAAELVAERVERFLERVRDGRTVAETARRAVRAAAAAAPVAIVSRRVPRRGRRHPLGADREPAAGTVVHRSVTTL
jgi:beta-phosphoglucomutase-like phosphatase (HAD superfamily)